MPVRYFPVAGDSVNANDFAASRGGGTRRHEGNDIFADEGTPLVAVDDGTVRFGTDPLGGNIANLIATDGARYYYAHLASFHGAPRAVRAGEVIGYLGRTGNAATTRAHVHFETHPCGRPYPGCAVDPAPLVNPAPRADLAGAGTTTSPSPLRVLAIAALTGVGVWALMNPRAAQRAIRNARAALPV